MDASDRIESALNENKQLVDKINSVCKNRFGNGEPKVTMDEAVGVFALEMAVSKANELANMIYTAMTGGSDFSHDEAMKVLNIMFFSWEED